MRPLVVSIALLATAVVGCSGARSGAGFRLPDGDPANGKLAFEALKCHQCHRVQGVDFPAPSVKPPVPVVLGGEIPHVKTDGDLLTSIINPNHRISGAYKPEDVRQPDGSSRMPDMTDAMTVHQLVDIVAFLQTRYTVVRPGGPVR
jgi:mono/diheme cytochrome c family protein